MYNYNTIRIKELVIQAMENIISALRERGYEPYLQIYGYLQENNLAYITSYNSTRDLIQKLNKEDVRKFIDSYLEKPLQNRKD